MKRTKWMQTIAFVLTAVCCGGIAGTAANLYRKTDSTDWDPDNSVYRQDAVECLSNLYAYGASHLIYVDVNGRYQPTSAEQKQLSKFLEDEQLENAQVYQNFDFCVEYGDKVFTNVEGSKAWAQCPTLFSLDKNALGYTYNSDDAALSAASKIHLEVDAQFSPDTGTYTFRTYGQPVFSYQTDDVTLTKSESEYDLMVESANGGQSIDLGTVCLVEDQNCVYTFPRQDDGLPENDMLQTFVLQCMSPEEAQDALIRLTDEEAFLCWWTDGKAMTQTLGKRQGLTPLAEAHKEEKFDTAALKISMAPKDTYLAARLDAYESGRKEIRTAAVTALVLAGLALAGFLVMLMASRKSRVTAAGSDWRTGGLDHLPLEALLILMFGSVMAAMGLAAEPNEFRIACDQIFGGGASFPWSYGVLTTLLAACFLCPFPSLVRRLCAGALLNTTMLIALPKRGIRRMIAALRLPQQPMLRRMWIRDLFRMLLIGVAGFFAVIAMVGRDEGAVLLFLLIFCAAAAYGLIGHSRDLQEISGLCKRIEQLHAGDFSAVAVEETALMYQPMTQLNQISDTVQQTVTKTVQAERMKLDLVTNVSHDLKTPLTSVISYIDLLSKEELPPAARDYVQILEQKSERLRQIVTDVFDLAKATSHADLNLESLDAVVLLQQVLADLEDRITASGKTVRTQFECTAFPIRADGAKLYRVLQNLLDNALRYSLDGTRIYVTLRAGSGRMMLSFTNTAAYEMKFTADEIVERFTRGDDSRTTDGNGLGLSIAKTFTEACGGQFFVEIDGDSFKVTISFPADLQPEAPQESAE